jgi:hypothetical protein
MRPLHALGEHFASREQRRDGALPPEVFATDVGRRTLRRADRARTVTLVGALALVVAFGIGLDGRTGAVLGAAGGVVFVLALAVWLHAAATLARAERVLRAERDPAADPAGRG